MNTKIWQDTITPTPDSEISIYVESAKNLQAAATWPIAVAEGIKLVLDTLETENPSWAREYHSYFDELRNKLLTKLQKLEADE